MAKRIFDILFSIIGLIFFSPCFLLVSILIKIDSKGPIFFLQERVGRNGVLFKIIKFRSMITDQNYNSTITTANDNRITTIGKIIRRFKIDELPELLNVLIGNMSFVGPRPDVPGYADLLDGEDRLILKLKPGITSLASLKYVNEEAILASVEDPISYNKEVIFPDKVKLNLNYYYNRNIWIDIKVIFATIFHILKKIFKIK
ncbi:MAG: sugar transferase [Flavobacteriales bacterium]|nr:sugar transferase [Flavobacteriales bacterium]